MIESNSSSDPITLAPHLRPTEVESPKVTKKKKDEDELTVAGGGLGIRSVSWNPSGSLLAVGGYDDKVSQEQRASTSSLGDWHFLNIPLRFGSWKTMSGQKLLLWTFQNEQFHLTPLLTRKRLLESW